MDQLQNEDNNEEKEENQDQGQDNPSNDDKDNNQNDNKDENSQQETRASLDADYSIDEFNLDEQVLDTNAEEQNSQQIVQKNIDNINLDYKTCTAQCDEITKAEKLENANEASKLSRTLDQQLVGCQEVITKLANKLQRQLRAKQNRAW